MNFSNSRVDPGPSSLEEAVRTPSFADTVNRIVAQVADAHGDVAALDLLQLAVEAFGCTAAVFASFVRNDATTRSCRYLFSRGHALRALYATISRAADDPWLTYASQHFEPRRSSELVLAPDAEAQRAFLAKAAEIGFRDAFIVPSHAVNGPSRIGVLCLGSDREGYFANRDARALLSVPASAMSLHLHIWWHARLRADLINRVPLTTAELDLARMLLEGLNTKQIARRLDRPNNTIDSQFSRLARRLGVSNRHAAAELLRSYGVI